MPDYGSKTSTFGRNTAGARALWRATGMKDEDFHKPIIAVANSFTQFVPGSRTPERHGGNWWRVKLNARVALPKNLIPLPWMTVSRWVTTACCIRCRVVKSVANSVQYMANAHCADALVCISNCSKNHSRHADGGVAPQYPSGVCLWRANGSGGSRAQPIMV